MQQLHKEVLICGANQLIMQILQASKYFRQLANNGKVFENTQAVLLQLAKEHKAK